MSGWSSVSEGEMGVVGCTDWSWRMSWSFSWWRGSNRGSFCHGRERKEKKEGIKGSERD